MNDLNNKCKETSIGSFWRKSRHFCNMAALRRTTSNNSDGLQLIICEAAGTETRGKCNRLLLISGQFFNFLRFYSDYSPCT
jgi:hypothetical protein